MFDYRRVNQGQKKRLLQRFLVCFRLRCEHLHGRWDVVGAAVGLADGIWVDSWRARINKICWWYRFWLVVSNLFDFQIWDDEFEGGLKPPTWQSETHWKNPGTISSCHLPEIHNLRMLAIWRSNIDTVKIIDPMLYHENYYKPGPSFTRKFLRTNFVQMLIVHMFGYLYIRLFAEMVCLMQKKQHSTFSTSNTRLGWISSLH